MPRITPQSPLASIYRLSQVREVLPRAGGPTGVLAPLVCPTCISLGLTSMFVMDDGNSRTVLPGARRFWYLGNFHFHDPNVATGWWHCSQGHNGLIDYGNRCPNCHYGKPGAIIPTPPFTPALYLAEDAGLEKEIHTP